jgi:hypothetical protein
MKQENFSYDIDRKMSTSTSSFDHFVVIKLPDQNEFEKNLLRKIDKRLLPLIFASFFIANLDRSNIGNARLVGLETSLNLNDQQFQIVLAMFFVGEVTMKIPSNLVIILFFFSFFLLINVFIHIVCIFLLVNA